MVTEQLYRRNVLFGCFRLIWLWLLIAIMKSCAKRCALQLYRTSLPLVDFRATMLYLLQNFFLSDCPILILCPLSFKITLLKSNTMFGKRNGKINCSKLSAKFNLLHLRAKVKSFRIIILFLLLLLVSVFGRISK